MKKLLVDMDGVVVDYYGGFLREWRKSHPEKVVVEEADLTDFYVELSYPPEHRDDILSITTAVGFFASLRPIDCAVDALSAILEGGVFDPFICTSPDIDVGGQACWTEKAQWVEEHLGREWLKRLVMTKDKTAVRGDYLVDDRPDIVGAHVPEWERVVYDQPYNRRVPGYRLARWSDWTLLEPFLTAK